MKTLSQAMEDYLEAIWIIYNRKKVVRVKDIMNYFKYKVSSVNSAIKILIQNGLIIHEKYEHIELTADGEKLAAKLYNKHKEITRFFIEVLKVDKKIAEKDACTVEHYLNKQTYQNLISFMNYIKKNEKKNKKWLDGFSAHLKVRNRY